MRASAGLLAPAMTASRADLPSDVAAALDDPATADLDVFEAAGIPFATRSWGDSAAAPLLLIHGVTASSRIWWRIGPALAGGLRRRGGAVDPAGHGRTGHRTGEHWGAGDSAARGAVARG